jgi:hypothetical protein
VQTSNLNWILTSAVKLFDRTRRSNEICASTAAAVRHYPVRAVGAADSAQSALPELVHLAAIAMLCDGSCEGGNGNAELAEPPWGQLAPIVREEDRSRPGDDASVQAIPRAWRLPGDCTLEHGQMLRAARAAAVAAAAAAEPLCACRRAFLREAGMQEHHPQAHSAPALDPSCLKRMLVVAKGPGRYAVVARVEVPYERGDWSACAGCASTPLELRMCLTDDCAHARSTCLMARVRSELRRHRA